MYRVSAEEKISPEQLNLLWLLCSYSSWADIEYIEDDLSWLEENGYIETTVHPISVHLLCRVTEKGLLLMEPR